MVCKYSCITVIQSSQHTEVQVIPQFKVKTSKSPNTGTREFSPNNHDWLYSLYNVLLACCSPKKSLHGYNSCLSVGSEAFIANKRANERKPSS